MSKIETALYLLSNNPRNFFVSVVEYLAFLFPDRLYLQVLYRLKLGRKLNLHNPMRFTEKLQWLKLYNRIPLYTDLVDKEKAKSHVAKIIGEEHVIPTLGAWDAFEEICFADLPEQFVLKTTNGGGGTGIVICRNKSSLDEENARKVLNKSLKQNIYLKLREWPYKNVSHRIIAEKYMEDETGELRDFKFFCFDGEPKAMLVASNRYSSHNFTYFDMDFNKLPIVSVAGSQSISEINKPSNFEEMKEMARKLSQGFPHVRVDMYTCGGKIYFGELTFFDSSGFDNMSSDYWDLLFGSWLTVPENKIQKQ